MSVVDQRAALAAGVRRLLVRMALVVGGVFAVTAIGWLSSGTAAHADELPSVPPVSALLDHAGEQLSTPDIKPVAGLTKTLDTALPDKTTLAKTTGLGHTLDKTGLAKALPPTPAIDTPDVNTVTKQVVPEQPRTTSVPVVHHAAIVVNRTAQPQVTRSVTILPTHQQSHAALPAPMPVRPAAPTGHRHNPVLPPVQPVGSSDSTMHGTGGLAGGAGGASLPATPVLGGGLQSAGTPSTPRLAVAPGLQPGTSPD